MLNVLHIIARYNEMLAHPEKDWQPRVFILAGKAASAYYAAKQTIRLINDVANVINNDERLKGRLKVVFISNYSVSLALINHSSCRYLSKSLLQEQKHQVPVT